MALNEKESLFFSRPYPLIMPMIRQKAHEAGIKLPFPVGVMCNSLVGTQTLALNDMALGFGRFSDPEDPQKIDISDIVVFNDVEAQFLGDRKAGLFSLNYRFGIRGKNWFSN